MYGLKYLKPAFQRGGDSTLASAGLLQKASSRQGWVRCKPGASSLPITGSRGPHTGPTGLSAVALPGTLVQGPVGHNMDPTNFVYLREREDQRSSIHWSAP